MADALVLPPPAMGDTHPERAAAADALSRRHHGTLLASGRRLLADRGRRSTL